MILTQESRTLCIGANHATHPYKEFNMYIGRLQGLRLTSFDPAYLIASVCNVKDFK